KYNYNGHKLGTTALLLQLIPPGTPLVVGVPTVRSLTITNDAVTCLDGDQGCRIARLPANTAPAALPAFNPVDQTLSACTGKTGCQTLTPLPLQGNGGWQSTLLGQTVTFTLNTRLDPDLLSLSFVAPSCVSLPKSVLTALSDSTCSGGSFKTGAGLLYLANRALAG